MTFLLTLRRRWHWGGAGFQISAFSGLLLLFLTGLQFATPNLPTSPWTPFPSTAAPQLSLHALLLWSSYWALFVSVPQVLSDENALSRLAWVVFLSGALLSLIALAQISQGTYDMYFLRKTELRQTFGPLFNRSHASAFLAISFFCGLALLLSRFRVGRETEFRSELYARRGVLLLLLTPILIGLIQTRSAGGILCLATGGSVLLISFWKRGEKRSALLLVLSLATAFLAAFYATQLWDTLSKPVLMGSMEDRLELYRDGFRAFRDAPIFGHGAGAFETVFPAYKRVFFDRLVRHAHSTLLEIAIELGITGTLLLSVGIASILRTIYFQIAATKRKDALLLRTTAACGVISFLFHNLWDFSSFTSGISFVVIMLAGALSSPPVERIEGARTRWTPMPRLARAAIILLLMAGTAGSLRTLESSRSLYFFKHVPQAAQPYYLTRAIAWDALPHNYFLMGATYAIIAQETPAGARVFYKKALPFALKATAMFPLNGEYRNLLAYALGRLERAGDAHYEFQQAHRTGRYWRY